MQGRFCSVFGCGNPLSDRVSHQITLCGAHQYAITNALNTFPGLKKYPRIVEFIKAHPGGSVLIELEELWGIPLHRLYVYVKNKEIIAKPVLLPRKGDEMLKRVLVVSAFEIARVSDQLYEWVEIKKIAPLFGMHRITLARHAKKGRFGEVRMSFSESLIVRKRAELETKIRVAIAAKRSERYA